MMLIHRTAITSFSSLYSHMGSNLHFDMEGVCLWVGGTIIRIYRNSVAWNANGMKDYAILLEYDKFLGMVSGVRDPGPLKGEDRLQVFPAIIESLREPL